MQEREINVAVTINDVEKSLSQYLPTSTWIIRGLGVTSTLGFITLGTLTLGADVGCLLGMVGAIASSEAFTPRRGFRDDYRVENLGTVGAPAFIMMGVELTSVTVLGIYSSQYILAAVGVVVCLVNTIGGTLRTKGESVECSDELAQAIEIDKPKIFPATRLNLHLVETLILTVVLAACILFNVGGIHSWAELAIIMPLYLGASTTLNIVLEREWEDNDDEGEEDA